MSARAEAPRGAACERGIEVSPPEEPPPRAPCLGAGLEVIRRTGARRRSEQRAFDIQHRESPEIVTGTLLELPTGTRLMIGFDLPVMTTPLPAHTRNAEEDESEEAEDVLTPAAPSDGLRDTLENLQKRGFGRLFVRGVAMPIDEAIAMPPTRQVLRAAVRLRPHRWPTRVAV